MSPYDVPRGSIDVHQHLWPEPLVEALRRRERPPRLVGWTLHLDGEPPFEVDPAAHEPAKRAAGEPDDRAVAALSLSAPLGIEGLSAAEATPLLDAWHEGARALPPPFAAWASVHTTEPDLAGLAGLLAEGFVGLQVPATALATPCDLERLATVLEVCVRADRPVLVHPGPVAGAAGGSAATGATPGAELPGWWPALVSYPAQLQASWWAWHVAGRSLLPGLRICFAAGAGLAPVHHERLQARGGSLGPIDPGVFADTSSYGPQALDALARVLGIDALVLGSDRPYAEPITPSQLRMGAAASHAIHVDNPRRLLEGGRRP
ncbi:amidohydrolase family protein [Segeticoccus rhizosphaerae]|jgi:hypothetical protein|uniref:amidohydrolase family protein n=1 Tax=Segeticoccus rhizosphaerae TaxID=1104777 RepID=UPI0010BFACD4|nr:amidohydrolase family protein [Ornithinicoccus soli]